MDEYEQQANEFLAVHNIEFNTAFKGEKCPLWCDGKHVHGDQYQITFKRVLNGDKKRLILSFWNSLQDKQNRKGPTAYDVLAAIQKYDVGTFEDFCGEFGYDTDSRKAETTYNAVVEEWKEVKAFFTVKELEELQDIQ